MTLCILNEKLEHLKGRSIKKIASGEVWIVEDGHTWIVIVDQ